MKNYSYGLKKLKIIEQIAIVFFIAVVIPISISGIIISNINQHSMRKQLRESAIIIASMISDEVDFYAKSHESTLSQIATTLNYLPTENAKKKYINEITKNYPNYDKIYIVKSTKELAKISANASMADKPVVSTQMKDGSFLVVVFNLNDWENTLFKSIENDSRQIYVIDKNNHLIASHNFTADVFADTIKALPTDMAFGEPIIFGNEKNQPIVYLKMKNPAVTILVNTTEDITQKAIVDNRIKIILAVLTSILAMMLVIGFYIYYLYINMRQLFKAVIALSKGNYQRQIRLLVTSFTPFEIVFLANEFNNMASEIHKSYIELQRKNIELKQLNEFRSNLLDTVSHELRTPLTSIQGYTSRLMRKDIVIDDDTKAKSLRIIKEQTERLKRLIEDLLTIPDIEKMRLRVINENVDLTEVLNQAELLLRKHDGHEIIFDIKPNYPEVYADKGRLEQVFVNLFENAVKYSYENSPIWVDATYDDKVATIVVKNKCDIIPEKKLATLFEKFIRLDDEMTRTTRGTGLGLFIVKGLVDAMEGSIQLASNEEFGFIATIKIKLAEDI